MYLKHLSLQNFRNYSKSEFNFSSNTTLIVGPNTCGKTNIIEAIYLLATGKSFRADKDFEMVRFGEELARVKGKVNDTDLEVVLTTPLKKYLVNGVGKRRVDFASHLALVLFSPQDLEIIVDSPHLRRNFLNDVLEQVDRDYRLAFISYSKALRQRNALLEKTRETGVRNEKQFEYWDTLLIKNGEIITEKREKFIDFINNAEKEIFDFIANYDRSIISKERLLQYEDAEIGAGVTLVGPHRDDFSIRMYANGNSPNKCESVDVRNFGSRGQQRLAILQLKLLQLLFVEKVLLEPPLLLLDDIFSELDKEHIQLVLELVGSQQTILTTTHKEFFGREFLKRISVIELGLNGRI